MKEIIAIIRPKMVSATKEILESMGFPSITASAVLGRGKQRGIAGEVSFAITPDLLSKGKSGGMKFVPKRFLSIIVEDEQVEAIVNAIVKVNQTAQVGDGKIFISPIEDAVRVRTGECGSTALV
jgi:nitrogen regulatory protein PII 2